MGYTFKQSFISSSKYSIKCPYSMSPNTITVHNTYNDASAANEVSYMKSNNNTVSFHTAIDDKEVIQAIPYNRNAWHAGDGGKGNGNRKSISIEICYSKSGGDRFTKAEANAAKYIAKLLNERNWDISRVRTHKSWSGKDCPHRTLPHWNKFLGQIQTELEALRKQKSKAAQATAKLVTVVKKTTTTAKKTTTGQTYKITANILNVREGAGTQYKVKTTIKKNEIYTIVSTKKVGKSTWGKLKSGAGWINLSYAKKI